MSKKHPPKEILKDTITDADASSEIDPKYSIDNYEKKGNLFGFLSAAEPNQWFRAKLDKDGKYHNVTKIKVFHRNYKANRHELTEWYIGGKLCGKTKAHKESPYVNGGSTTLVCPEPLFGNTILAKKEKGLLQVASKGVGFYEVTEVNERALLSKGTKVEGEFDYPTLAGRYFG